MGVFPIPTNKQFSQTSRVSYNSTQFQLYLYPEMTSGLTGQGLSPPRRPLSHFTQQLASPGCPLCFRPTGYRLQVPSTLCSFSFLEQLTEHGGTFTYWITALLLKTITPKWSPRKIHRARRGERAFRVLTGAPLSLYLPVLSNRKALLTLS